MWYLIGALLAVAAVIASGGINFMIRKRAAVKRAAIWMNQGDYVAIDGIKTRIVAKGAGEPLLLIHGSQMSLYDWRYNIDEFANSFRVIALDMVGCGFSDKPDADYSPEYFAQFIGKAMDHLGIAKASFVASSWGGGHVLQFAQLHPERVNKLVLSSPCGQPHRMNLTETVLSIPVLANAMMLFVSRGLVRKQLDFAFEKKELIDAGLIDSVYLPMLTRGCIRAIARSYRHANFAGVKKDLSRISCPVLICWGAKDRIHAKWMMDVFRDEIPGLKLHVIQGVGHMPHEEAYQEFNRAAIDFLAG